MNYVSYIREKSCLDFDDQTGLNREMLKLQSEHIQAYIDSHAISIDKEYIDKNDDCSAFENLLHEGMKRLFKCVVVDSIFRVSETLWRAKEVLFQTFFYAGIHFIVIEDDFDSRNKSQEQVAAFFDEKYKVYKSRLMTWRNKKRWEDIPKVENEESSKKSGGKHAYSMIAYEMYDKESGTHFNLRNLNGTPYFVLVNQGLHYYTNEHEHILVLTAEYEAKKALIKEKELAECVLTRLSNGEGKEELKKRIERIGDEMRVHFYMVVAGEKELEEVEEQFQACTKLADELEKAYSVNNPWIKKMLTLDTDAEFTKTVVKKYIQRIWVSHFKYFSIESKWEKWKRLLPEEWMV